MSQLALLLHYILVAQVLLHCEEIFAVGVFNFFKFFKDICGNMVFTSINYCKIKRAIYHINMRTSSGNVIACCTS